MRKNIIYGMILLAAMACNKENMVNNLAPQPGEGETAVRLTGEIAVPTRVEFDDTYGQFVWSPTDDKIAIHVSDGKRGDIVFLPKCYKEASVVPNDPASTCDFFFVLSEGQKRDFYAVYPASIADEENYGDTDLKVNLPSEYEIGPEGMGDWSPTPMVAVNNPSSQTLIFRHIGGLLRLTLNDVSPATASIEVSLGKRITGSFIVNDPASPVPYMETDDAEDVLTFRLSDSPNEYVDDFIINIPVPTGVYESLSVKAKDSSDNVIFSYDDSSRRSFDSGRGRRAETSISAVAIPLCFEAREDGSLIIANTKGLTFEYGFDNANWISVSDATINIPFETGDCIYLRANNSCYSNLYLDGDDIEGDFSGTSITTDGECYIYGNLMSLIDAENFDSATTLTEDFALSFLFTSATDIVNHPEKSLELPATTLTVGCYYGLFFGCSGLTRAPALPASILRKYCYTGMFYSCTGLVRAPRIPAADIPYAACQLMFMGCASMTYVPDLIAETIGDYGCEAMFEGCSALESAPAIPATVIGNSGCINMFSSCSSLANVPDLSAQTIGEYGCGDMFEDCTSLVNPPALPATSLGYRSYSSMFSGCSSMISAPDLPATDLANYCYSFMFEGCTALASAPDLPALEMKEGCYRSMFKNCVGLVNAPTLPAKSLVKDCYDEMFFGCSSLNYVKAMFIDWPESSFRMLYGVSDAGTFVMNENANWDPAVHRGVDGIPESWTIETATE